MKSLSFKYKKKKDQFSAITHQKFHESFIGWGRRPSGLCAVKQAKEKGEKFLLLEDGFLRSVGREDEALSIVCDNRGIYYDATAPSQLEEFIERPLSDIEKKRADTLIAQWRQNRLSKYNYAREYEGSLPKRFVLIVDQTWNDTAISYGLANEESFKAMLQAALDENPDCDIVIKTHPDKHSRGKKSYFPRADLPNNMRIHLIDDECHPVRFLQEAEKVYAVTSQTGFEALIWGKPVRCFGMPFYAGWGLTQDNLPAPERRKAASLQQLVHAALVDYPRYIDPLTHKQCEVERIMAHIALQRCMRNRFSQAVYALGYSRWKRPILRRFMQGSTVHFVKNAASIPDQVDIAIWGKQQLKDTKPHNRLIRVEDGFLRSVGLGVDLVSPLSWAFDDLGIYYDSSQPSRLESILAETKFSPAMLTRGEKLRQRLVSSGVTKYNLAAPAWQKPETKKKIILVPGQVEDDASIRFGAASIKTNLALLQAVRKRNTDAYILYKPHPDVVAGLRARGTDENHATDYCDEIIIEANTAQLLSDVDEIHCLTSLMGFEALLREKPVICYGQPFYSGWGLTTDIFPISRRKRQLHLNELVVGCLMLYPAYFNYQHNCFVEAEDALDELIEWSKKGQTGPTLGRKIIRLGLRLFKRKNAFKKNFQ